MKKKLKTFQETKKIFENLKTDTKSILSSEDKIDKRPLKKLKKVMLEVINLTENDIDQINQTKEDQIPTRIDYAKKREIDRSTLCSFDGPFQLIDADLANL